MDMEFKFQEVIMSQVENGMCENSVSDDFKTNFTKGYLKNRIVDFREPDVDLAEEVLMNLLELFKYYSSNEKDRNKAEELSRFIGMFICCCENAVINVCELSVLDDIIMEFVGELS